MIWWLLTQLFSIIIRFLLSSCLTSPAGSVFIYKCLYHALFSTTQCLYLDATIHNSLSLFPPHPPVRVPVHVDVCVRVWVQRLERAGWAGNGSMYNASAVHFQWRIAHDAADTVPLMPTIPCCSCLPPSQGSQDYTNVVKLFCISSAALLESIPSHGFGLGRQEPCSCCDCGLLMPGERR